MTLISITQRLCSNQSFKGAIARQHLLENANQEYLEHHSSEYEKSSMCCMVSYFCINFSMIAISMFYIIQRNADKVQTIKHTFAR